jgi:hypothetical protein
LKPPTPPADVVAVAEESLASFIPVLPAPKENPPLVAALAVEPPKENPPAVEAAGDTPTLKPPNPEVDESLVLEAAEANGEEEEEGARFPMTKPPPDPTVPNAGPLPNIDGGIEPETLEKH